MDNAYDTLTENCYECTSCLINKFDIRDEKELAKLESSITFAKASLLENEPISGGFNFSHYKAVHNFLFCDLFEWAGQIRTADISKKRTHFVKAKDIENIGDLLFESIGKNILNNKLSKKEFALQIADYYHSVNMLHPFREGNGRTQRAFFTELIRKCGYDINFGDINPDDLLIATINAAGGVMDSLNEIFVTYIINHN
jgi:cell filamentation protein